MPGLGMKIIMLVTTRRQKSRIPGKTIINSWRVGRFVALWAVLGALSNRCWWYHIDGFQHKGTMSTKPVLEKIAEIQRSYVPLCGHTTFVLLTPACTISSIDIITIFCNNVDKTSTFVELMAINSLCYMSQRNSICLGIKLVAGLS